MKKLAFVLLTLMVCISCRKSDDTNLRAVKVTLNCNVNGTLSDSPTIQYRDVDGNLKSEILFVGNWEKVFHVTTKGFNLFLRATGTIDGSIILKASASGNGVSFEDTKTSDGDVTYFDFQISTIL